MADLARIKRNVAKMASMSAPEADIDGYIASEGVTIEDVRNYSDPATALNAKLAHPFGDNPVPVAQPAAPGPLDYVTQGLSGLNEGIAMGLGGPVDLASTVLNLGSSGINALTGTKIPMIEKPFGGSQRIREGMLAPTIKPESDDPLLQGVRRVTQEVGAWAVPGGGLAAKTAKPLKTLVKELPAVLGSGAGAATAQAVAPGNPLAEFAGQMIGGLTPGGVARARPPKATTTDALRVTRDKAYEAVKQAGASYAPAAYDKMLVDLVTDVKGDNISPARHERAYSFITDMIQRRNGKPMTLTELDQLRQEVRRDLITPSWSNPAAAADAHFGEKILDAIDEMIATDTSASQTMKVAREAHSRLRKSELIEEAITKAVRRAESTGSGGNVNNAIRQNIRSILDSPKRRKAFSAAELASMEHLVKQGKIENLLRLIGKLSPSGNGLMAALGIGGSLINPMVGAASLAGLGAKTIADGTTLRKAAALQRKVSGSPQLRRPPPLPSSALVYAQGVNQMNDKPLELTVRGGSGR